MSGQYPIRAASRLTGLGLDTLRAWERRYKAVTPVRTERGRLYGDAEIRRLLLLRRAVESGYAIGQVASRSDAELEELSRAFLPSVSQNRPQSDPEALPALQPLIDSIHSYDYAAVNEELGRLALLLGPTDFVHTVVLPLMRLAGDNWASGTFHIAQEHMLSACMRNLLGGLVRLQRTGNGALKILLTTPPGELHEFGILAAAMLAVAHEFQVAYLGPNLPAREILNASEKSVPNAVVLGIMEANATPAIRDDVHRLSSELLPAIELWVGGSGAAGAVDHSPRGNIFVLEDMIDFERHLARLRASHSKEPNR
jgi:DNA-binding transcriptional MerR regulator/methylmalonyl-CoA mutase cobalamin-binding subunit